MIETHQLCKRYGRTAALRDVTLAIAKGTFCTVLGPNGSGKTTLMQILSTLSRPTSGSVKLSGFDPETQGNQIRKQIGVVSHQSFLYPSLTAYENLKFYGHMFGVVDLEDTISSLLHEFGLSARMSDPVRTFSRGMQQRLAIARALLHHPLILLLDEPFAGLDYAAMDILQKVLEQSRKAGRTVVLTTHDLDRGLEQGDQVVVLVKGRLVYTGAAKTIDRSRLVEIQIAASNEEHTDGHHR
jgi:heme exporter protein A